MKIDGIKVNLVDNVIMIGDDLIKYVTDDGVYITRVFSNWFWCDGKWVTSEEYLSWRRQKIIDKL